MNTGKSVWLWAYASPCALDLIEAISGHFGFLDFLAAMLIAVRIPLFFNAAYHFNRGKRGQLRWWPAIRSG
jgi:hypothetical protein